jgi:hypothetical protein
MDISIREIIRETRASINARLDMLEMIIQNGKQSVSSKPVDLSRIEFMLSSLSSKINSIENKMNEQKQEELPSIIIDDAVKQVKINYDNQSYHDEQEVFEESQMEEEEKKEEEVEEEKEEEEEEVVEQQELTEFEYKGMVLYRDGENKVYQMDEDGELVDTPIGVWNEAKQKVLRI